MSEHPEVECAGMPLSILNYGKQMVVLLDDDGKRFLQNGMTSVIKKLIDTDDEEKHTEAEQVACFRFDDSTPNLFGKVVWDTDRCSWKVTLGDGRERRTTYEDHHGGDLAVPADLSADAYMRDKSKRYRSAIDTWNELDKTKRRRLLTPLEITIDVSSSSNSVSSQERVEDSPDSAFS